MNAPEKQDSRSGFTLIESIIALILMSVALMALAPALFQSVNRQKIDTALMERDAVLLAEGNRSASLPWDRLDTQVGCLAVSADVRFPYTRCTRLDAISDRERRVVVTVTPSDAAVPPDSVSVFRTTPELNPFNMPE